MSDIKKINRGLWMSSFAWLILLVVSLALGFYLGTQYRISVLDDFMDSRGTVGKVMEVEEDGFLQGKKLVLKDKDTGEVVYSQSLNPYQVKIYEEDLYATLMWSLENKFSDGVLCRSEYIWDEDGDLEDIVLGCYDFSTKEYMELASLKSLESDFVISDYDEGKYLSFNLVDQRIIFSATDALDGGHAIFSTDYYYINLDTGTVEELDVPESVSGALRFSTQNYGNDLYFVFSVNIIAGDEFYIKFDLENNKALSEMITLKAESPGVYLYDSSLEDIGVTEEMYNEGLEDREMGVDAFKEELEKYVDIEIVE